MGSRALRGRFLSILGGLGAVLLTVTAAGALAVSTETATSPPAYALDDGQALTPPMGFNDWNAFGCNVSEELIKATADIFVSSGLKDLGYEYVNIDDCWMERSRDADGHLVPDPDKFPDGISGTADYVHSLGLKLGIYEDSGTHTCAGYPGSYGHEKTDAQDFADWGVDYLKYDNCNLVPGTGDDQQDYIDRYNRMRDALQATGRPIVFSICEWGVLQPWQWGAESGHLWRTTGDIQDNYASMLNIFEQNVPLAEFAGPGHWNDPDMLEIGNGGMTGTEYRSHFSLWSIMAAPLLIGTDLRTASQETMDILGNGEVIAVDQDPLGRQATVVSNDHGHWALAKPLADGDVAVALFNETGAGARIGTTAHALGLPHRQGYVLRDLWQHSNTETANRIRAYVPAHGTVMYRVSTDPTWGSNSPAVSFAASADTLGQGSAGQYIAPGEPVHVTADLADDGRLPVTDAKLRLTGPTSYEGVSYEAEAGANTISGAAGRYDCGACSGGEKVGYIGNDPDSWVRIENVTALAAGEYQLTIYGAVDGTRSFWVSVDGGPGVEVPMTGTSFSAPVAATIPVTLAEGANSIRFYNDTAYGPDLDRITVGGSGSLDGWTVDPPGAVQAVVLHTGESLTGDWTVTSPEDAAPGTYELAVRGSYTARDRTYPVTATFRLVVPGAPPLHSGYLSDQEWLEARNGWGPVERDMSNGEQAAGDGHPISIGGTTYEKGLGVHSPGEILYLANGQCSELSADVGIDDEKRGNEAGSVTFEIWADDTLVADSGLMTWQDPEPKTLDADISGASFVRLVVTEAGGGNNSDHSDWADAQVTCG